MKTTRHTATLFWLATAFFISACSSSSSGGSGTSPGLPYPDPADPSAFPTKVDTVEGTVGNNNSHTTATTLNIGETSYNTIYPIGDEDWFAVTLTGGAQYEFTVDNVSYYAVPKLELYEANGTTPVTYMGGDDSASAWGYFSANPRVTFTPSSTGTYYLKVYDFAGGVASYTLSSRLFTDNDFDTYSPHYDCDDILNTIYPWATESAGDTIDQSCSGYDWPSSSIADSMEPDSTFATAGSLPVLKGDQWDIIHRGEVYAETHTITAFGDVDFFKITVPAYSAAEIYEIESTGTPLDSFVYESDQVTEYDFTLNGSAITYWLDNTASATETDFYLKVYAHNNDASSASYALGLIDGISDVDGDGYFTRAQGTGWDCDDTNIDIHPGAVESVGDSIDSNCDGDDNI